MAETSRSTEIIEDMPKRMGRRPLPENQRRVQFGTRILPSTLQGLQKLAAKLDQNNPSLGRVIDELVAKASETD